MFFLDTQTLNPNNGTVLDLAPRSPRHRVSREWIEFADAWCSECRQFCFAPKQEQAIAIRLLPGERISFQASAGLGEIDVEELSVLKAWVRKEQASQVHLMLEEFRDACVKEQAVREVRAKMGLFSLPASPACESDAFESEVHV